MTARQILSRSTATDFEIRGTDGRTVCGIAAPFDSPTRITEGGYTFTETIAPGAFTRTIAERGDRVKLLGNHQRRAMPLGKMTYAEEQAAGLYCEFRVSQTLAGNEALAQVADGSLDGLSIGFQVIRDDFNQTTSTRVLQEVRLDEVSLTAFPAYESALVTGVRGSKPIDIEQVRAALALSLNTY